MDLVAGGGGVAKAAGGGVAEGLVVVGGGVVGGGWGCGWQWLVGSIVEVLVIGGGVQDDAVTLCG